MYKGNSLAHASGYARLFYSTITGFKKIIISVDVPQDGEHDSTCDVGSMGHGRAAQMCPALTGQCPATSQSGTCRAKKHSNIIPC